MAARPYRIRGIAAPEQPDPDTPLDGTLVAITRRRRLVPGRARDGVSTELEVVGDEVVRVELDNGFVLWTRADALLREHGRHSRARDGGDAWEIDSLVPPINAPAAERGLLGLGVRVLEFFGVDVKEAAARTLGKGFEDHQLGKAGPGLYRVALGEGFALAPFDEAACLPTGGPLLVFLHGTASSCEGSFGKLWSPDNATGEAARTRLAAAYPGRAFALEHRSLTESPVTNALALASRLPQDAELHLVSHSRGGLVGELLCLGQCEGVRTLLDAEGLHKIVAADRTIAEQLGLLPLSPEEAKARDAAYEADREALGELIRILVERNIRVTRFVRAACPARGTTLASGRLDRWLSMLDFLAGRALGASLFVDGLDFLLAVVKERTDPRTLPGVEAMMPGSALTRLLHHPDLVTTADLSVIAGDAEGDTVWQKLKLLVSDWFYGADHDLVVNTGSMSGGLRRPAGGARYRLDRGARVDHFSYFRNADSVGWLLAGLTRADGEDGGFRPLAEAPQAPPRWREAVRQARGGGPRPLAVMLPGTMGSALSADGQPVWLHYTTLLRGGLGRIALGATQVSADDLLDDFYGPLIEFLAEQHRVEVFPYDWRRSVRSAAARLAEALEQWLPQAEREGQPVHLVAHSMGGLVARAMIADGSRGTAVWKRITRLPGSRLLMLGTPNLGSYEAVRWLTGFNPTQARLALLDFTRSTHEVVDLVREYPGLVELLPFAAEDPDFSDPARWTALHDALQARWKTPPAETLRGARETWNLLRAAAPDPAHMAYVAGCQPATVLDYELVDHDEARWLIGRKRLAFIAGREGDGTVSWASGLLDGVPAWYLDNTAHDALCVQRHAFPAYLDILRSGTTTRLPTAPPRRARTSGEWPERFELPALPPADGVPAANELRSLGFGGGVPATPPDTRAATPPIELAIRHGDLSYARFPVLVGHYRGDTIVSAEAVLDRQLGGALACRAGLGLYPGRLGSSAQFFNPSRERKPAGAIVVGLGEVGELTPGLLESGIRTALLDHALQIAQWPDERFGPAAGPRRASVSCLLVGTGAGALSARDSIEAIVRAAIATNARLQETSLDGRVWVDRIEFVELFADIAIGAAESLRAVLASPHIAAAVRWPAQAVESGRGGRHRVRFDEAQEWWQRVEIVEEEGRRDSLRFIFITDRARAEETLSSGQLGLADAFIRDASASPAANPEAAFTLHEMLLPVSLREAAPRQANMVLLVDPRSARYPWELLENRWSDSGRPPAVAAGLVRQIRTANFRTRPVHADETSILLVGNPDLDGWESYPDLPGARTEAGRVAERFEAEGWQVERCIDPPTHEVLASLHRRPWRILHLAGHGEHEFPLPQRAGQACDAQDAKPEFVSGMVIGRETFLTPGDIEQMRWVPELVFINCCHLGTAQGKGRGALAANLGMQFIRMGVRAVVAAGWAVDDAAALAFAEAFYGRMLAGETFGEAVRAAREEVWLRFRGVNTWGAYQCYGDPDYTLLRGRAARRAQRRCFHSSAELCTEFDNLAQALKAGRGDDAAARIAELLEGIPDTQRDAWLGRADVCAALGSAWAEARSWQNAIELLERAMGGTAGDCPLRALEQLANCRARLAADERLAQRARGEHETSAQAAARAGLLAAALADLEPLCKRAPTAERLSLLGSTRKRQALVASTREARLAALLASAQAYRDAFESGGKQDVYPFTNWAGAVLVAAHLDPAQAGAALPALEVEVTRLRSALAESALRNPDFWASASLADLDLVLLLARSLPTPGAPPPGRGRKRPANVAAESGTALVARITQGYRAAIDRGASPRERASVIENLDCLIELLDGGPAELLDNLRRMRDML
ncbi:MAG: CHAT domain-containing protein [Thauera sp.]|nr:CHAT domain-containing protein [Thauera sp.]